MDDIARDYLQAHDKEGAAANPAALSAAYADIAAAVRAGVRDMLGTDDAVAQRLLQAVSRVTVNSFRLERKTWAGEWTVMTVGTQAECIAHLCGDAFARELRVSFRVPTRWRLVSAGGKVVARGIGQIVDKPFSQRDVLSKVFTAVEDMRGEK